MWGRRGKREGGGWDSGDVRVIVVAVLHYLRQGWTGRGCLEGGGGGKVRVGERGRGDIGGSGKVWVMVVPLAICCCCCNRVDRLSDLGAVWMMKG